MVKITNNKQTSLVIENTFIDFSKPNIETKLSQLSLVNIGKRKIPEGKIFVLGDESSGKTKLVEDLNQYNTKMIESKGSKPAKKRICCCHCCCFRRRKPKEIQPFALKFTDASPNGDCKIRAMNYLDTDVIVLCFHADCEVSFKNLKYIWLPEVKKYCPPEVPIIVVCLREEITTTTTTTKKRENSIKRKTMLLYGLTKAPVIPKLYGEQFSNSINAFAYVECSDKNEDGFEDLIKQLIKAFTSVEEVTENTVPVNKGS